MTDMTLDTTTTVESTPHTDGTESVVEHMAEQLAHVKPLLRGWLHEIMFFLSIPAGLVLVACAPTVEARVAAAIYSFGVIALFIVLPIVLSLIQARLEGRKERMREQIERVRRS